MPVKVVDASAVSALLFAEPDAEEIANRLRGYSLASPALLTFEVGSVCLKKMRRHAARKTSLLAAYGLLRRMEIVETAVNGSEVVVFAEQRGLTVYDAAYLWLAKKLGAELVTLDKRLSKAAKEVP